VYSPQVLDHFEHPRNAGLVKSPNASAQAENPVCGDVLKLTARLSDGRFSEVKFLVQGCVPAVACASALTELIAGKTPRETLQVSSEELVQVLGGLPEASANASHLAIEALGNLLKQLSK
jgi:NifU homolog involved in Fe-S cluster formation